MSIVDLVIEQGSSFDWSQVVFDMLSLEPFLPQDEWPERGVATDILKPGYARDIRTGLVIKVTGPRPSVSAAPVSGEYVFTNCEGIVVPFPEGTLVPTRSLLPGLKVTGFWWDTMSLRTAIGLSSKRVNNTAYLTISAV